MRLSRVYVDQPLTLGEDIQLNSDASHYLSRVLRLKLDDRLALFNGKSHADFIAQVTAISRNSLDVTLLESVEKNTDSNLPTHIIQALSRSDHIDFTIQKATELGVNSLTFFNAEFTQSPIKSSKLEKKIQHWQSIAIKACEQCGRHFVPTIRFYSKLQLAVQNLPVGARKILLNFCGSNLIDNAVSPINLDNFILLGGEGGLSDAEISLAEQAGFKSYQLGPRVLRTETAAIAALSLLQYQLGDMKI